MILQAFLFSVYCTMDKQLLNGSRCRFALGLLPALRGACGAEDGGSSLVGDNLCVPTISMPVPVWTRSIDRRVRFSFSARRQGASIFLEMLFDVFELCIDLV